MIFNISAIRNFPTVAVRHSGNIQDEVIQFHFALPFIALAFPFGTGLPPPSSKTKDKTHSVQRQINLFSIALHSTSNALQNITLDEVSRGERWEESSEECSDLACMEELVLLQLVQNKKIYVATVAGYVGESVYVFLSLISLSKMPYYREKGSLIQKQLIFIRCYRAWFGPCSRCVHKNKENHFHVLQTRQQ